MNLPIGYGEYQDIGAEPKRFSQWLDKMTAAYPELSPCEMKTGYTLHDFLPASVKLPGVRFRRIKLKSGEPQVMTICSSDAMHYIAGYTSEVGYALFLRRLGVSFWGLT